MEHLVRPLLCVLQRGVPRQRWVWGAHVGSSSAEDDLEVLLDMMDAPKEQQLGCLGKGLQPSQGGACPLPFWVPQNKKLGCTGANPAKGLKMIKGQEDLTAEGI